MKENVEKEYCGKARKILGSSLNVGDVIKAGSYTVGILDWIVDKLKEMDRQESL